MIYVAGGPMKTGSTFLYQILSEIVLLHGGRAPKPYGLNDRLVRTWESEPNGVVIKLHNFHAALKMVNCRVVVTVRDPRDVVVSLMNFRDMDFETVFESEAIQNWGNALTSWDGRRGVTYVRYERMIVAPAETVKYVGDELGFRLHSDLAEFIARKWGVEANRMRAEKGFDITERHYMSTRHIHSAIPGQWREALTAEQVKRVEELFEDEIQRFGYQPG